jgi:hypothetical protein
VPFVFDREFGYVDAEGRLLFRGTAPYRAAVGRDAFISYPQIPENLVVQGPRGEFRFAVDRTGYPVIADQGVLIVDPDGVSLDSFDLEGQWRWRQVLPASITTLSSRAGLTVTGTVGGSVHAFDSGGDQIPVEATAVGTSGVVHAIEVAPDGASFATVIGSDPRRSDGGARQVTLSLYRFEGDRAVPVLRRQYLRDEMIAPVVRFPRQEPLLIYSRETADGEPEIVIDDLDTGAEYPFGTQFPVTGVAEDNTTGLNWILSRSSRRDASQGFAFPGRLTALAGDATQAVSLPFAADRAEIMTVGELVAVHLDDRILAFSLRER